jgi:hypothetical protein
LLSDLPKSGRADLIRLPRAVFVPGKITHRPYPPAEPGHRGGVVFAVEELMEAKMGRGILLWLLGVPIPVIILLWLFFGH